MTEAERLRGELARMRDAAILLRDRAEKAEAEVVAGRKFIAGLLNEKAKLESEVRAWSLTVEKKDEQLEALRVLALQTADQPVFVGV